MSIRLDVDYLEFDGCQSRARTCIPRVKVAYPTIRRSGIIGCRTDDGRPLDLPRPCRVQPGLLLRLVSHFLASIPRIGFEEPKGFEPLGDARPPAVFKTATISRSVTAPRNRSNHQRIRGGRGRFRTCETSCEVYPPSKRAVSTTHPRVRNSKRLAWGPGLEPGPPESESGILPIKLAPSEPLRILPTLQWRRGWGSNPRGAFRRLPVFETGAFDHSATPPSVGPRSPGETISPEGGQFELITM